MNRAVATVLAGSVALAAFAATAGAQSMPAPRRTDSAGVRIIEYATIKTTLPAFNVAPKLIADVGGLSDDPKDEIEATGYEVAVRLADGRIAVAENHTVRILTPAGKFVRVIGRRGGGPGEFNSQIVGICVMRGDTLIVRDGRRTVSIFDSAGTHVQSTISDGYLVGNCGADGSMIASAPSGGVGRTGGVGRSGRGPPPAQDAFEQQYELLWRMDRLGKRADSIGVFPGSVGAGFGLVDQYFSVGIFGDRIFADNARTTEVKSYSPAGKLVQIIRWRDPLVRVTQQIAEQLANRRIPTNDPNRAKRIEQQLSVPYLPTFSAYSGFFIDRAGRVWVRDNFPIEWTGTWKMGWTLFTSDGVLLGRYEPPAMGATRTMVTDAGNDFVVIRSYSRDAGVQVMVQGVSPAR